MIDLDNWLERLTEDPDAEIRDNEIYQHDLFQKYVLRNDRFRAKRLELYRQYQADPGRLTGEKGLRKQLAAFDLSYFGRAYLAHYFLRKSPEFHEELDEIWTTGVLKGRDPYTDRKYISRADGSHSVTAAPRGHAKSTNFTFKDNLHAILYQYKHYAIIISDSSEQAEGFLDDLKTELESNDNIIQDFGLLKGDKVWRSSVFLTSTGVKVEALGSGKKIRGRRHGAWRPDLLVLDDIENDENVQTPEQRKKLSNWFYKAVSKCGDTYTDIMYIGTVLHYDSLLSNVLKNPEYETRVYQAVIHDADNQALWDEWAALYVNLFDPKHKETAEKFYKAHEAEMKAGSLVLWEEKWSYKELMKMKLTEGISSFNSELMNNPIDPDNADFNEEWFDYYEDGEVDFKKNNFLFVGANDPSLGKNKKSDTSSIITLALDLKTGYMYVLDASVEKRKPDVIIDDVINMHERYLRDYGKGYYKFGVETVQFQYFFKDVMAARALEQGAYIPIEELTSSVSKELRIRSLQPFVKNKWIKFNRRHKELIKQMTEFPMGKNDDAPDGLHMAVILCQIVRKIAGTAKYQSVVKRMLHFGKGAY